MRPSFNIPQELPIAAYLQPLLETLRTSPVTIVCGDTGSGKTTQLPKLAAMARPETFASRQMIGITQPRRLAAVAMGRRLADEMQSAVGALVGYQHRFEKKLSPSTRFKLMTDGVLLAETRSDPLLKAYSTLIIDEAHERSLNIDFLLGILKGVLPHRHDLRVVISSATLDAEKFSSFFDGAPIVTIPGRLFPIETISLAEEDAEEDDLPRRVAYAVDLLGENSGDILVFLPGEREIRETMAVLESRRLPRTELLPLLASLPAAEQARVFKTSLLRRIILATNVAETSVTIPAIRCVIDSGVARIKRYSAQRHVQQLKIEPISQASARQRRGRCGRVGPGVCVQLYSEEAFAQREEQTAPEIKRSALAGVILTMAELKLGRIETFPFIEPPSGVAIREGYRELLELGALAKRNETLTLTAIGRALATFPLEPRYARILLAADAELALRDALTVVAAMACDEPLLRPIDKREQADQSHARFRCPNSDFNARLKLWAWFFDPSQGTSETIRRKRCKAAFVSYPKMREWQNVRAQLEQLCQARGLHVEETRGGEVGLHRALLCGLLSRIGHYDTETRDYRGAFALHFSLFPGSGVAQQERQRRTAEAPPARPRPDVLPTSREWVLVGELVETSRLFGRMAACIDFQWIEPLAGALCKVHRYSPFWDAAKGFVRIHEAVTLFGLPLASGRVRDLSRIDPEQARTIFIADALAVPESMTQPPAWLRANWQRQRLLEQLLALRRTDVDTLHDELLAFYEASLPATVCSMATLKKCPPLPLEGEAFAVDAVTLHDFPETVTVGGATFPLQYCHDPQAAADGVTILATPETLHLLAHWHAEWLVPGLLPEKILWMIQALPSRVRHVLGALSEVQGLLLSRVQPYRRPLSETLFRLLRDEKAVRVDETVWEEARLPAHLRMNFRVEEEGETLGEGRDLAPLLARFAEHQTVAAAATIADPALARLACRQSCLEALRALGGNRWNSLEQLPAWPAQAKAFIKTAGIDSEALGKALFTRALEACFLTSAEDPQTEAELQARYSAGRGALATVAATWKRRGIFAVVETARLEAIANDATGIYRETLESVLEQLAWLVFDGFPATVPPEAFAHYPLWLSGIAERLDRARTNPAADLRKEATFAPFWKRYLTFVTACQKPRHDAVALDRYRWLMESLRLMTFCPATLPPERPSVKLLEMVWEKMLLP